jgi:tetratricopeptide (TPR) repeat protein
VADFRVNFALACLSLGILQSGQAAEDSYHQARQHLEQLTARDPNNVHHLEKLALVWTGLGNLQKNNGRTSQALDSYQQARLLQEKLVVFQPDKPVCRAALAQTWQGIAQIQQKLGQVKAAEASYRNARQHIELAATQSPALPPYQLMLANICCSLGDLQYKAGQLKEASASYQQARQIKERLVANYPTVLSYQADLATFWFDLGLTQSIVGRFREAEDSFFQALKIRQKLIHDDKNSIHAIELSKIYQFLGNAQAAINRYQEAEASYLEAIKIREKLMAKDPTKTTLLTDLGATYTNVGNVLLLQNKPDKALYWVEKSIDLLSKVNRRASPQSNLHLPLRFAFTCEAQALGSLARYAESVRGWSHVLTYSDSAQQAGVVQVRQHCLQNALRQVAFYVYFGYHQPAAQSVAILTPLTDLPPDTWPQLARVLALCSVSQGSWFLSPPTPEEREKYAAQAVELLKRSRVPGFFGARAQAERWWREAELAPLRERRDFRQLLGK